MKTKYLRIVYLALLVAVKLEGGLPQGRPVQKQARKKQSNKHEANMTQSIGNYDIIMTSLISKYEVIKYQ